MEKHHSGSAPVPDWVHTMDMAVWVSGPGGTITFVNPQAEELLGLSRAECLGLPCHRVIGGVDADGGAFCGPDCAVACQAKANRHVTPVKFRIPRPGAGDRTVQVITMIVSAPEGASLVHCAIDADPARRAEEYVTRLATRTPISSNGGAPPVPSALTAREREVLSLLAEDQSAHAIAAELHVSHTTVRNHIQRIVAKLGAHSTMEAVARHLLSDT